MITVRDGLTPKEQARMHALLKITYPLSKVQRRRLLSLIRKEKRAHGGS